jgi:hypothetical protein
MRTEHEKIIHSQTKYNAKNTSWFMQTSEFPAKYHTEDGMQQVWQLRRIVAQHIAETSGCKIVILRMVAAREVDKL